MKKAKAKQRYTGKSERVQEYMEYVLQSLNNNYNEIPDQFVISLDMLANMLTIMNDAYDLIQVEGLTKDDKYRGKQSSTALQTYLNAQNYAARIISSFGLTPASKAKIKKDKEEVNVQEFLEHLTA